MIVLVDGIKYRLLSPENEAWLEKQIEENYQHIFGDNSIYFPKKKIKSKAGIGTIPDAYVIIPGKKLMWCILEVELASHSVYDHVFPQLTKFRRAIEDSASRKKIRDFFYDTITADQVLEAQFRKQIGTGEIHKTLSDMVDEKPLIVVAIDQRTDELEEALLDFGGAVKVIEFKTYRREGVSVEINAYCFEPIVSSVRKTVSITDASSPKSVSSNNNRRQEGIDFAISGSSDEPAYLQSYRKQLKNPNTLPSKILEYIRKRGTVRKDEMRRVCVERLGCKSETSGTIGASFAVFERDGYIRVEGRGKSSLLVAL